MAKVTWRQLHDLKLGGLADYIDVWDKTNKGIKEAIDDAENVVEPGVKKAFGGFADIEVFSSGAQAATKALTKLTDQLDDAKTEGDAVEEVLRAGKEDLKDVRDRFRDRVDEINNAKPDIDGAGSYSVDLDNQVVNVPARPSDEKWNHKTTIEEWNNAYQPKADAYAEELDDLIKEADEIDQEVSNTLSGISRNRPEFNSEADEKAEEFSKERQEADAEKVEDRLTDGEITEEDIEYANDMMKKHEGEEYFAVKLFDDLGAKGLAEVYGQAAIDSPASDKEMEKFQKYLGTTLATATDPDNNGPHLGKDYVEEIQNMGADVFELENENGDTVSGAGYQILAPLFESGEFDDAFLVPIAEDMIQMDASGYGWSGVGASNDIHASQNPFNIKNPSYVNPLNSMLLGLGHSPEASLELFSKDPTMQENRPYAGYDTKVPDNYLDYLLERDNKYGIDDHEVVLDRAGLNAKCIGAALESATTGLDFESPDYPGPKHNEKMVDLTNDIFDWTTKHPDEFKGDGSLHGALGSFGDITGEYIEDFYKAYIKNPDEPWLPESYGEELKLPYDSPGLKDSPMDQWMQLMGYNDHATAVVASASAIVAEGAIAEAAGGELGDDSENDRGLNINEATTAFGRFSGEIMEGRLEAAKQNTIDSPEIKMEKTLVEVNKHLVGRILGEVPVIGPELGTLSGALIDELYGLREKDIEAQIFDGQAAMADDKFSKMQENMKPILEDATSMAGLSSSSLDSLLDELGHAYYDSITIPDK